MLNHPKRILVSPLRFLGDGVLTVPLLRALRQHYEHARIDVLVPPHMVNLLERCPYLTEAIVEPKSKVALLQMIRARRYELGIVMRRSVSEALVMKLAGIKTLIGYDEQRFPPPLGYKRWGWFLDEMLPFPPLDTDIPQVRTYLQLLSPLGADIADETLELWADEDDKLKVAALFNQHGIETGKPLAMLHATSASLEKAMTVEQFVPALQMLHQQGFEVVTAGTAGDGAFYETLSARAGVSVFNLCGQTTLRQTYALMLKLDLLLSIDSAPIHMAAAAGVPQIVGIYGPTNHVQWRPYPYEGHFTPVFNRQLDCRPCAPKVCGHNRCRTDLTGAAIAQALADHLNQTHPRPVAP